MTADAVRPVNPTTVEPLEEVPVTGRAELDRAVSCAADALGRWSGDSRIRRTVLAEWARVLTDRAEDLARALVTETGKPIAEARLEVRASSEALAFNAGLAGHVGGRAGGLPDGTVAHLVREPVGVTAFVVPWNWPMLLLLRDLAPALAAGVTAVVKPAPQTTLVTRRLLELGREAGLPDDVVTMVVGAADVGATLIAHAGIRAVAFTGSSAVGTQILKTASTGMKRTLLELGGKAGLIICADADVGAAAEAAIAGAVVTAGQMCMACTRVLVDRRLYREVAERLTKGFAELRIGDPHDQRTDVGPIISESAHQRLRAHLDSAESRGETVFGGEATHPPRLAGFFMAPAVVTNVQPSSPIVQDELFGPIVSIEAFDDDSSAIRLANATRFGLAMSVWTRDIDRAWYLAGALHAGTVWVNGYNRSYPAIPSGGFKMSGLGRTRGIEGVEQFTELKHIHFSVARAAG